MSYLGRYRVGDTLAASLLTRNAAGTPTVPDRPPTCEVWSNTARVASGTLPVNDRYGTTAYFLLPLRLGSAYAAGPHRVTYNWLISGVPFSDEDAFEVLPGGHADGGVRSMFWTEFPHAKFLLHHLESGVLVFGRNPRA